MKIEGSITIPCNIKKELAKMEKASIMYALSIYPDRMGYAAELLGLQRTTFVMKVQRYELTEFRDKCLEDLYEKRKTPSKSLLQL